MSTNQRYPNKVFLNVEDIRDNLSDFQIFDTRYNLKVQDHGAREYARAHAAGATFVNVDEELCGPLNTTARHPLPDAAQFVEWCKSKGITQDVPVLCYDDDCGAMGACRMWWMLDALGVEAYVLNGGFQAYHAAGLPLESGEPPAKLSPASFWPFATEFKHHVTARQLPANAKMADARAANRFATTVRPYGADALPGHIEGAVNIPYQSNIIEENGVKQLRDLDEIRSNFLKALDGGYNPNKPDLSKCVFYCGSGLSAALNLALARHLQLGQPYFYCGSWSEYAGLHYFPLVRDILSRHGMWMKMHSPCLGEHPKADADVYPITVDDARCELPDDEIKSALQHLHVGESCTVYFGNGRVASVAVLPKH